MNTEKARKSFPWRWFIAVIIIVPALFTTGIWWAAKNVNLESPDWWSWWYIIVPFLIWGVILLFKKGSRAIKDKVSKMVEPIIAVGVVVGIGLFIIYGVVLPVVREITAPPQQAMAPQPKCGIQQLPASKKRTPDAYISLPVGCMVEFVDCYSPTINIIVEDGQKTSRFKCGNNEPFKQVWVMDARTRFEPGAGKPDSWVTVRFKPIS